MKKNEAEMMYEWGAGHAGCYAYPAVGKKADSCFVPHDGSGYIREYGFDTIAELKGELARIWQGDGIMEEIIRPVAVAAMKNRPSQAENTEHNTQMDAYIYIF